jgi:hypothetical protein
MIVARVIAVVLCAFAAAGPARADILELLQTKMIVLRTISTETCVKKCLSPSLAGAGVDEEIRLLKDLIFVTVDKRGVVYPIHGELDGLTHPLMRQSPLLAEKGTTELKMRGDVSGDTLSLSYRQVIVDKIDFVATREYHITATQDGCNATSIEIASGKRFVNKTSHNMVCKIVPLLGDLPSAKKILGFHHLNGNLASAVNASYITKDSMEFSEFDDGRYFYKIDSCDNDKDIESLGIEFTLKGGSMSGSHRCKGGGFGPNVYDELTYTSHVEISGDHYILTGAGERRLGSPGKEKMQPMQYDIRFSLSGDNCTLEKLAVRSPGWWPSAQNTSYWIFTSTSASTCAFE